jgi:fucose 4-O-acetylase-like acetyltransferase
MHGGEQVLDHESLVVIAHNPFIDTPASHIYRIIFLFHMPLFYYLSGLVYNYQTISVNFIKKKAKGLLLPYFSTLFFWLIAKLCVAQISGKQFQASYDIKTFIYSSGPRLGEWVVLWFLTSLFVTQIFFTKIDSALLKKMKYIILRLLFMMMLLLLGIVIMRALWLSKPGFLSAVEFFKQGIPGLPWSLDLMLLTVFYYYLGVESKNGLFQALNSKSVFILSSVSFFGLYCLFNERLDLNFRLYENYLINSLEAVTGIMMVISLSKTEFLNSRCRLL